MIIRHAKIDDLPRIVELLQEIDPETALNAAQSQAIWRAMARYPYYKILVAEHEGEIAGTCSLIVIDNLGHGGARLAVIENVVIAEYRRGQGLGSLMVKQAAAAAAAAGCYKLMLSSHQKRLRAHNFYEQLGFEQHGISYAMHLKN